MFSDPIPLKDFVHVWSFVGFVSQLVVDALIKEVRLVEVEELVLQMLACPIAVAPRQNLLEELGNQLPVTSGCCFWH